MTPAPVVLVVDDEVQIRRLLRLGLEGAGYRVFEAADGASGLKEAANRQPEAVVLDLGLPDLDGLAVLKRLREWTQVPVLILTVSNEEEKKVAALDAGADDYLTKPFGSGELLARLRALLRRAATGEDGAAVAFGDVTVDLVKRRVTKKGRDVHLTTKEYALLRLLVVHRGKVLTHRFLLREVWGPNAERQTHYLRVFMTHVRQKIEDDPARPAFLKTESGVGYRLADREDRTRDSS